MKQLILILAICYISQSALLTPVCDQNEFLRPDVFTIDGTASYTPKPTQATISFGIDVKKPTASEAIQLSADLAERAIRSIKIINSELNVQTADFSLQPYAESEYDNNSQTYVVKEKGFQVTNQLIVKTLKIEEVGKIIDTAVKAGVNNVSGVNYDICQEQKSKIKEQLIEQAIEDAQHKAEIILNALNMKIQSVKSVQLINGYNTQDSLTQSVNVGFIITKNS